MPCNTCNSCNHSPCRCGCGYSYGYGSWNRPRLSGFSFRKLSVLNGIPLANAVFQLFINGVVYATAVSDQRGVVRFNCLPPGTYTMMETVSPQGYAPSTAMYTVVVAPNGYTTIDGQPTYNFIITNAPLPTPEFTITKTDAAGAPLAGATFTLSQNGAVVRTAQSTATGAVSFGTLNAGVYTLTEIAAPDGYTPNGVTYNVVVGTDGTITIDGTVVTNFVVTNTAAVVGTVAFTKIDAATGLGLEDAEFQLLMGNVSIGAATSAADGSTAFNRVPPGSYTMAESRTPSGYVPPTTPWFVEVSETGVVTINGEPTTGYTIENTPVTPPVV